MKVCGLFILLLITRPGLTQNPACTNIDFESLPLGAMPLSSSGWTVYASSNSFSNSLICPATQVAFSTPSVNTQADVLATPILDPACNNVSASPFGGNHIVTLNKNHIPSSISVSAIRQNFNVGMNNFIYRYAYKGVLYGGHVCCDDVVIMFRFYDALNNLIPALCRTLTPTAATCLQSPTLCILQSPQSPWTNSVSANNLYYTPNWAIEVANLSAYIGSNVTVEVIASNCTGYAHHGYLYYDAQCTDKFLYASGNPAAQSFTACDKAKLSAPNCFNSYLWNGPSTSTINGLSTATIETAVSGTYSLTVMVGTVSLTQTLGVSISSVTPSVSIISPSLSGCVGASFTLLATGNALQSYTWSTASNASSLVVTPTTTTVYSVTTLNSDGCAAADVKTVVVHPNPVPTIISDSTVCAGDTIYLAANPNTQVTFLWSTGSTAPGITVSPQLTTVFQLTMTTIQGCSAIASKTISVIAGPVVNITPLTPTVCPGQLIGLFAFGSGVTGISWSTGQTSALIYVTPSVTTTYTATAVNANGCMGTASRQVKVLECVSVTELAAAIPQIRIYPNPANGTFRIATNSQGCGKITDLYGGLVKTFCFEGYALHELESPPVAPGVYFVLYKNSRVKVIVL
jgi:hypothetical protein